MEALHNDQLAQLDKAGLRRLARLDGGSFVGDNLAFLSFVRQQSSHHDSETFM